MAGWTEIRRWTMGGLLCALALAGCEKKEQSGGSNAPSGPTVATGPLGFAPVSYFENNCSRCHGPYGAFYAERKRHSESELRKIIDEMAAGPGNAPLEGRALDAEVAYHRSLLEMGAPFLVLVEAKGGDGQSTLLSGEVTPGSKVVLQAGDQALSAEVKGHRWTLSVPSPVDWRRSRITATRAENQSSIVPAERSHSHAGPPGT